MHQRSTPSLSFVLASLVLAACTPPSPFEVRQDINRALEDNQKAKTQTEWQNSDSNPESLFQRWKMTNTDPKVVCQVLLEKTGQDLALFEEEIKAKENAELVASCRPELEAKLEKYWQMEKIKLRLSTITPLAKTSFKFPDNVQTRDVSEGYKAVSGDLHPKELVLTFDDGPHPQYTSRILTALNEVNAKAIFFAQGKNVGPNTAILRQVGQSGHAIGSHSWDHKCLPAKGICARNNGRMLSYTEAIAEIRDGHKAVLKALGWVDPFFRFPYGESSTELKRFLIENSTGEFYWSIDSEDWKNRSPADMLSFTMSQVERQGRGIILMHDVQRKTAEALPDLLKRLYFKGYSIVLLQSANPEDRFHSKLAK